VGLADFLDLFRADLMFDPDVLLLLGGYDHFSNMEHEVILSTTS
jgi:hypothetical protein